MDGAGAVQGSLTSIEGIGHLRTRDGYLRGWTPLHSLRSGPNRLLLQVFAHRRPFSHVHHLLVPGMVVDGKRPSRPSYREILGLSEDVWMLTVECWDGDPNLRPHVADVLALF